MLSEVGSGLTCVHRPTSASPASARAVAACSGLFALLMIPAAYLWGRIVSGDPFDIFNITLPQIDPMVLIPALFFLALILVLVGTHGRRRPLAARDLPPRADRRHARRRHRASTP